VSGTEDGRMSLDPADHALALTLVLLFPAWAAVSYRRLARAVREGVPGVRRGRVAWPGREQLVFTGPLEEDGRR
jgi:hypothetical protein